MNIPEILVGKEVRFIVGFSSATVNGGSTPARYAGKLTLQGEDWCTFADVKIEYGDYTKPKCIEYSNNMVVNSKYIISIAEV